MGPGRARGPTEAPDPARGDRRPGEMGSLLNGAETGIRWKRGEELKLGCTFWGHGKQSVDGGGGGLSGGGEQAGGPQDEGRGDASWGRAGARGASTCRRAGRAAQVRKRGGGGGECGGQRGPRTGAGVGGDRRGAGHRRGAEGTAPQARTARGGIRAGGREAGAPHLRGGGGAAAAHGGAGGARRRRRARSYAPEPLGMRAGGRPGRARPGPARLGGDGSDGDGGENSRGGAARGRRRPHPPAAAAAAAARLRLRSCCCSCSPAERGGRRRRHLPLAPASHRPRPVPLPLPLPGCSRLLLGAARVSHQTPRPQCSAAPRRADGGATAVRTRPGPWARAGACAAPGPFRGGTEAAFCLGARGRLRLKLPKTRRARSRNAADLLPDPRGTGRAPGLAPSPGWARHGGH